MRRLATLIGLTMMLSTINSHAAPEADLWPFWDAHQPQSTAVVDHSLWQDFLDQYLEAHADGVNRVAYQRAAGNGGDQLLQRYVEQLSSMDPRTLNRNEQMAYWINLYNAVTVVVVMNNPNKGSILRMGKGFFSAGPWGDKLINIAEQELTLDDVEHRILRPIWKDHRIHYAVNCASIGCPNLNQKAFTASTLEALLDQGEQDYINHERGVSFSKRGKLQLSKIFEWYGGDFAQSEAELVTYLSQHNTAHADQLASYDGNINYEYDWSLNSHESR